MPQLLALQIIMQFLLSSTIKKIVIKFKPAINFRKHFTASHIDAEKNYFFIRSLTCEWTIKKPFNLFVLNTDYLQWITDLKYFSALWLNLRLTSNQWHQIKWIYHTAHSHACMCACFLHVLFENFSSNYHVSFAYFILWLVVVLVGWLVELKCILNNLNW